MVFAPGGEGHAAVWLEGGDVWDGSAEDVVKQIQDVQSRDISLEERNRLINSILSHSSRYRSSFQADLL